MEQAIALSGVSPRAKAELALAYTQIGKSSEALKSINDLKDPGKQRYVSPFEFAWIYGGLGDKGQALEWREKAYKDRSPSLNPLKSSPAFSTLQSDAGFTDLVRRFGSPIAESVSKFPVAP